MASLPSQASRRRGAATEPPQSIVTPAQESSVSRPSTSSLAVPLNDPRPATAAKTSTELMTQSNPAAESTTEPKRCWICQLDETEDTPDSSRWRKPCPCSLDAHDDCLLEWVASEEAPKKGEMAHNKKLFCPQCGHEIKIQRPKDIVVDVVEVISRAGRFAVFPSAVIAIFGCTYSGLLGYGVSSMTLVFGWDETQNIFASTARQIQPATPKLRALFRSMAISNPFFPNPGSMHPAFFLGLPLLGPALVLLRTRALGQVFALSLPIYFLSPENRDMSWPPTPGLSFALLPYIKTAYNEAYYHLFGELEKKWDLAVQRKPRDGETAEQIAAQAQREEEDDAIFQVEFAFGEEEAPRQPFRQGQDIAGNPAPVNGNEDQPNRRNGNNENGLWFEENISTSRIVSTVMGALFFPAVSSIMGSLLKHTLPRSWVTTQILSGKIAGNRGLLKEQWGRSIVGGCLFVVLKDMVTLYCKWKKARDFGSKKVLDYVPKEMKNGKNGRKKSGSGNTVLPPAVALPLA